MPAYASKVYLGGNFLAEYDYPSRESADKFITLNSDSNYYVSNIVRLGIGIAATYVPFESIPLGISANYQLLLPVGYARTNIASGESGDIQTYVNRTFLAKHIADLGLSYDIGFGGSLGMYVDAGGRIAIHTVPDHNNRNDRTPVEYSSFTEYGIYADIGMKVTHQDKSYFKIGVEGATMFSGENTGLSFAMKLAGGYIFSF